MMVRWSRLTAAFLILGAACTSPADRDPDEVGDPPSERQARGPAAADEACGLPPRMLQRIVDGYHPRRSGDIQIVPQQPNFVGRAPRSHSGPWGYLQRVPLLLYGPGHVPAAGQVSRRVTLADMAPTLAEHIGFGFDAPDGSALREAIEAEAEPPLLVVVVVWDGGGRNVLRRHSEAWPTLDRLIRGGAWFQRATLGSSPSVTPSVHTTIGTGALPRTHGLVDMRFRVDGGLVPSHDEGPQHLLTPTLADQWDLATDNAAEVGLVAFRTWHLGMIGHGAALTGADRDLVALLDEETKRWALWGPNADIFALPEYANDAAALEQAIRRLDLVDGVADASWLGERVLDDPDLVWRTPAYTEWQTRVLEEMIRREGFGADDVPDLLFTNYKQIDLVGHTWGLESRQMREVVRASDRALNDLVRLLDREVGEGQWVLALTADHGVTPDPERTEAARIDNRDLTAAIERRFGEGVVQALRPTQVWLDRDSLRQKGHTVEDVAAFIADYRADSVGGSSAALFAAAFPSEVLRDLPCGPVP